MHLPKFSIVSLLIFFSVHLSAQTGDISGVWKIEKVDIASITTAKSSQAPKCYFQDLYDNKVGIEFKNNGTVNYANYGNEASVYYSLNNGQLLLSASKSELNNPKSTANEQFSISLAENRMTLIKAYATHTETYTLTK
ncbi:MAG: hypothetical protein IPH78_05665 [Bacteroidetes bacterium]|nr:hypothetical protein [Bacteroidota bacterium]MBK8658733.1 hypothetical protein [Bacteroidota bacterium]